MTFAEDYEAYNYWVATWRTAPEDWEVQRDLEADAMFYRENKRDITKALDMLYRARSWWADHPDHSGVGTWFLDTFSDDLNDDLPF